MPSIYDMLGHPPNILLFVWNGIGDTLGIYGHRDVHAPWCDVLGYQGMLFENVAPAPTIASALAPLPALLATSHYARVAIGRPLGPPAAYEAHLAPDATIEEIHDVAQETIAALATHAERPFLLSIGLHEVGLTREQLLTLAYDEELAASLTLPEGLDDTGANRQALAAFYGQIQRGDHYIGRIMDEVDDRGVDEDTLVILASDGPSPFAVQACRPMLIFRWSSILPGGWRSNQPLSFADLLPTIADLARLPTANLPGTSLLPLLENP